MVTMRLIRFISRLMRCHAGISTIEYGMILAFIVIAIFASLQALAGQTVTMWNDIARKQATATSKN